MDAAQPASGFGGQAPEGGQAPDGGQAPEPGGVDPGKSHPAGGILDAARAMFREFGQLAKDHLDLAALEAQRTGKSVVTMLVYAVAAALLLVTAWLGLLAAIAVGLVAWGLHPAWAILLLVALNLSGAFALYLMILRDSANLGFPATMRNLKSDAALIRSVAAS